MTSSEPTRLRACLLDVELAHRAVNTSRATLRGRPALLLLLWEPGCELVGVGEACPLASFGGHDSYEQARAELSDWVESATLPSDWSPSSASCESLGAPKPSVGTLLNQLSRVSSPLSSASARHAVESALLDRRSQELGLPLAWQLAPDAPAPLRLPQSALLDPLEDDFMKHVRELHQSGINTFKLKLGRDENAELHVLSRLPAWLTSIAREPVQIRLDPNLAWSAETARRMLLAVQRSWQGGPCQLQFVEDPTTDFRAWRSLSQLAPLAIDEPLLTLDSAGHAPPAASANPESHASAPEPGTSPGGSTQPPSELGLEAAAWEAAAVVVLKPMALGGMSRVELLARQARQAGKKLSVSHYFDGPSALWLSTELAFAWQSPGLAPGLGEHAGLTAWRDEPSIRLLAGELPEVLASSDPPSRSSPTPDAGGALSVDQARQLEQLLPDVRLHAGRIERPPLRDGLSILEAARHLPAADALQLCPHEGEEASYSFAQLATEALEASEQLPAGPFLPLVCDPSLQSLRQLYAAWLVGLPVLLLHPALPPQARAALVARATEHAQELRPGDAVLISTSGSSGTPHLTVHTRASLIAAARASNEHLGLPHPADRWLLTLPFAHIGGLSVLTRCLLAGACVVQAQLAHAGEVALAQLRELRINELSLVPTQLARLLPAASEATGSDAGSPLDREPHAAALRLILVGGAACPPALLHQARERGLPVAPTYGMTELASQIATCKPDEDLFGTAVGRLLPGVLARTSEQGSLLVGGPMRFRRYLGEPTPLSEDGLFITSDRGELDGRILRVLGRADELIVSGGENISPQDVEAVLLSLQGVAAACVVGLPDPTWGERVVAVWSPARGSESAADATVPSPNRVERENPRLESPAAEGGATSLRAELALHLPAFAHPKAWIRVSDFPLLPSGKTDRLALRRLAGALLG